MTRWSLFLQTLSLLHHFLGLYYGRRVEVLALHWQGTSLEDGGISTVQTLGRSLQGLNFQPPKTNSVEGNRQMLKEETPGAPWSLILYLKGGGAEGIRTLDPLHAKQVLSH